MAQAIIPTVDKVFTILAACFSDIFECSAIH
jgi:hypothetical protein